MGLSLFSVESLFTCEVFVLKYWTQVLLCCVLPVKTHFWISSVLSILWYFQAHGKVLVNFDVDDIVIWVVRSKALEISSGHHMNHEWKMNLNTQSYIWCFLKGFEKFWAPWVCWNTLSFECWGVNEGTADMQNCWPYLACCMIDSITGCIWS